jgi:hypothetical protein
MKQQSFFIASPPMYTRTPKNEAEETDEKYYFELADAFAIEAIATFFICVICITHGCNNDEIPANNWSVEFLPGNFIK